MDGSTASELCKLARSGDLAALKAMVQSLNSRFGYSKQMVLSVKEDLLGVVPLHVAAEHGHLAVLQFILADGEYASPGDNQHISPLQLAALNGHNDIVLALLRGGADVNMADKDGDTSLHWAAQSGHVQVINTLSRAGARVNTANSHGLTPLHRAALKNRAEAIDALMQLGAAINAADEDGRTPMHLACRASAFESIRRLFDWGALSNIQDSQGRVCWELGPSEGHAALGLLEELDAERIAAQQRHRKNGTTKGITSAMQTADQRARGVRTEVAPQRKPTEERADRSTGTVRGNTLDAFSTRTGLPVDATSGHDAALSSKPSDAQGARPDERKLELPASNFASVAQPSATSAKRVMEKTEFAEDLEASEQEALRLLALRSSQKRLRPNASNIRFLNKYGLGDAKLFAP